MASLERRLWLGYQTHSDFVKLSVRTGTRQDVNPLLAGYRTVSQERNSFEKPN